MKSRTVRGVWGSIESAVYAISNAIRRGGRKILYWLVLKIDGRNIGVCLGCNVLEITPGKSPRADESRGNTWSPLRRKAGIDLVRPRLPRVYFRHPWPALQARLGVSPAHGKKRYLELKARQSCRTFG
jgi:hypothetical protein